ncbi:MAG: aromatic ring-hydroxylating dioxygenase subunit alpha [Woeseiaceae bacterium]|jgi:phenylpropionate dioxygenase-like ring-hydroxylating dioxygenase large terminal subunit|nr:aromatic ring-hydroxylating dioxygenase subunit alpha [Woeseiaceae bacterium]
MSTVSQPNIEQLISNRRKGYSLEQAFYCEDEVFRMDMERVIGQQWLLVDHVSRIPQRGDYFLFRVGGEQIIVIRENENDVHAFFNVCRHRGSRVCLEDEGRKRLLTCPYHAWSYNLNGSLKAARLMPDDFDQSQHGLHRCHLRIFHGLIFVCLSKENPPDFDTMYAEFDEMLGFHGFSDAKVAVRRNYPNAANWKLVVENFIECYHCAPAHPEYCSVHPAAQLLALGAGPGSGPEGALEAYQPMLDEWEARTSALGHPTPCIERSASTIDMAQLSRFPINDRNFESETRTGEPACTKLMGKFTERDHGETAFAFNPISFILACNDFAMMVRFTPIDGMHTDVQLTWLVHKDAKEGVDYDPDNVAWLWDVTTKQDKRITEDNQAGILSSRYQPGPYSEQERLVMTFSDWYLDKLEKH